MYTTKRTKNIAKLMDNTRQDIKDKNFIKIQLSELVLKERFGNTRAYFYRSDVIFWFHATFLHPLEKMVHMPKKQKVLNGIIQVVSNNKRSTMNQPFIKLKNENLNEYKVAVHIFSGKKKYKDLIPLHKELLKQNDKAINMLAFEQGFKLERTIKMPLINWNDKKIKYKDNEVLIKFNIFDSTKY